MAKIKYEILLKEPTKKEAKIVQYSNEVLKKENIMPSFMVNLQSKEDVEALNIYLKNESNAFDKLSGICIPFDRINEYYVGDMKKMLPNKFNIICDIKTEIFYSLNYKPKIKKYYYEEFKSLPKRIKSLFKEITDITSWGEKQKKHYEIWNEIIKDKTLLNLMVTSFINKQSNIGVNILSSITPFLINSEDIDLMEDCFKQHKKLFHSEIYNIEQEGKIIALNLTIKPSFLKKRNAVSQLLLSINGLQPKAIIFKIDTQDIRRESKDIIKNYVELITGIAQYSEINKIPSISLNSNSEGLILLARGIDCFVQPLTNNFQETNMIMGKESRLRLSIENPHFMYGKVYDYRTKDFLKRDDFLKTRFSKEGIMQEPLEYTSSDKNSLISLTPKNFRIHSKRVLIESRNLELNEIHDAIKEGTIRQVKSKFIYWDDKQRLFPE